jgi:hypothetical protein
MRAVLILLVTAVSCPLARPIHAQAVSLGVRVGVSRSHVIPDWDGSRRVGVMAGLAGRLQLTDVLALQVEALYSQKGWRNGAYGLDLDYVDAPILVRVSIPPRLLGVTVSALAGVSVSRELSCQLRVGSGNDLQSPWPPGPVLLADCIAMRNHLIDFGLAAGAEIARALPRGQITIEARYLHGTKNLSYGGHVLRNRSFAVLLGVSLDVLPRRRAAA